MSGPSANMTICGFSDLRFSDPILFVICRCVICGCKLFSDLNLLQVCNKYVIIANIGAALTLTDVYKINKNFKRQLLGLFETKCAVFCRNLLNFDLRIGHENLWIFIFILQTGTSKNLRICESRKNPRICGFADFKKS
jgi:hypothetical protein